MTATPRSSAFLSLNQSLRLCRVNVITAGLCDSRGNRVKVVAQILSPAQRAVLFDPPSDLATIERLYTLGPDDLVEVFRRRRPANRIGYAVQLGYLRHPGRANQTR